jgi:hypothetical protein
MSTVEISQSFLLRIKPHSSHLSAHRPFGMYFTLMYLMICATYVYFNRQQLFSRARSFICKITEYPYYNTYKTKINKNTTQNVLNTTMRKQTEIT